MSASVGPTRLRLHHPFPNRAILVRQPGFLVEKATANATPTAAVVLASPALVDSQTVRFRGHGFESGSREFRRRFGRRGNHFQQRRRGNEPIHLRRPIRGRRQCTSAGTFRRCGRAASRGGHDFRVPDPIRINIDGKARCMPSVKLVGHTMESAQRDLPRAGDRRPRQIRYSLGFDHSTPVRPWPSAVRRHSPSDSDRAVWGERSLR